MAKIARSRLPFREGYQVLTACNAEEGWALFQRQAPPVCAVVTDLVLPGDWNGLELARRVRAASPTTRCCW